MRAWYIGIAVIGSEHLRDASEQLTHSQRELSWPFQGHSWFFFGWFEDRVASFSPYTLSPMLQPQGLFLWVEALGPELLSPGKLGRTQKEVRKHIAHFPLGVGSPFSDSPLLFLSTLPSSSKSKTLPYYISVFPIFYYLPTKVVSFSGKEEWEKLPILFIPRGL